MNPNNFFIGPTKTSHVHGFADLDEHFLPQPPNGPLDYYPAVNSRNAAPEVILVTGRASWRVMCALDPCSYGIFFASLKCCSCASECHHDK